MKILSHRGYWDEKNKKNTIQAFDKSFSLGFGTETDIRDLNEELVISHDIPSIGALRLSDFLKLFSSYHEAFSMPLALNIKADGLAKKLSDELSNYKGYDFFVFDMSVPDSRSYFDIGIPVFTRMSEVEQNPVWLEKSMGIWLDSFDELWFDRYLLSDLLQTEKRICIVSSELHRRDHFQLWELLSEFRDAENLMLCTDYPQLAQEYLK